MADQIDAVAEAYAADAVTAAEREAVSELDEATRMFMEVVDCEAWEVRDSPTDRIGVNHATRSGSRAVPVNVGPPAPKMAPSPPRKSNAAKRKDKPLNKAGGRIWPWGKHAGKEWRHVPVQYLCWFVELPDARGPGAKQLQIQVREYLKDKYGICLD